jgi:hypothetical protein
MVSDAVLSLSMVGAQATSKTPQNKGNKRWLNFIIFPRKLLSGSGIESKLDQSNETVMMGLRFLR